MCWVCLCWGFLKITPKVQLNGFTLSMFFSYLSRLWHSFYYFHFTYSAFKYPHRERRTVSVWRRMNAIVHIDFVHTCGSPRPNQLQSNWNICQSIFLFCGSWCLGFKWFAQFTRFARAVASVHVKFRIFSSAIYALRRLNPTCGNLFLISKIDLSNDRLERFICWISAAGIFSPNFEESKK